MTDPVDIFDAYSCDRIIATTHTVMIQTMPQIFLSALRADRRPLSYRFTHVCEVMAHVSGTGHDMRSAFKMPEKYGHLERGGRSAPSVFFPSDHAYAEILNVHAKNRAVFPPSVWMRLIKNPRILLHHIHTSGVRDGKKVNSMVLWDSIDHVLEKTSRRIVRNWVDLAASHIAQVCAIEVREERHGMVVECDDVALYESENG